MSLIATTATGWSTGFGNLLRKELDSWWRTRRWLVHLVLWLGVISGLILLVSLESRHETTPARGLDEVMNIFFQAGGFFALIGAVLVTQGAIVGERSYGTAAWVLTKPTTRKAFVLSKFVGITGTFLLLSLVIPAVATLIVTKIIWGVLPGLDHFAEAVGLSGVAPDLLCRADLDARHLLSVARAGRRVGFGVLGGGEHSPDFRAPVVDDRDALEPGSSGQRHCAVEAGRAAPLDSSGRSPPS